MLDYLYADFVPIAICAYSLPINPSCHTCNNLCNSLYVGKLLISSLVNNLLVIILCNKLDEERMFVDRRICLLNVSFTVLWVLVIMFQV